MRYLVTGGLGYIGSWVTRTLARSGHEVIVLSRGQAQAGQPDLGVPYTLCAADISGPSQAMAASLEPLLRKGLDGCVHLASYNENHEPGYGPKALQVNTLGTRNLLEALVYAARAAQCPPPPLVYASTFHVYGREQGAVDETTPPAPRNEYALTHLAAEEYCRYFNRMHGVPLRIVRLTNGYGAPLVFPFSKWYLLLPDLCRMAFRDQRIALRSSPNVLRDFLWMGDVACVIERLLGLFAQPAEPDAQTLNLASGAAVSIESVARLAASVYSARYGKALPLSFGPSSSATGQLTVDARKLYALLGENPFTDHMEESFHAIFDALEREEGAL